MKKVLSFAVAALIAVVSCAFAACSEKKPLVIKESDTYIVINVTNEQMEITENSTLVEYMNTLKDDGELDFELDNGMVSSINGIENPADWSSSWMLYTDDAENSNTAWGTVEYEGKVYGSAMFGAETLKVKDGCVYIWVYKSL